MDINQVNKDKKRRADKEDKIRLESLFLDSIDYKYLTNKEVLNIVSKLGDY